MHTNNATKLHYWCAMLLINLIHMMIRRTTNSFRLSRNIPQRWLMLSLVGSCWLSAVAFAQVEDTRKMMRMMNDKNAMAKMMRSMPKGAPGR